MWVKQGLFCNSLISPESFSSWPGITQLQKKIILQPHYLVFLLLKNAMNMKTLAFLKPQFSKGKRELIFSQVKNTVE